MSESIATFVEQLESADSVQVHRAAQALAQAQGSIEAAAIPLLKRVGTAETDANEWIVSALEQLEAPRLADAGEISHVLQAYLDGEANSEQAYWAATLLGRIGPPAGAVSCPIVSRCAEMATEPEIVARSTWALAQFGAAAEAAQPVLLKLAQSTVARTAHDAQRALRNISGEGTNR